MSTMMYHVVELATRQPIGKPRHSLTNARADAELHFAKTQQHCGVFKEQLVWVTSFLSDLATDGGLAT